MKPKILIGCPTYEGHAYCLEEWINNVRSFDYPNFEILLVCNSKSKEYLNKIKKLGINYLISNHYSKPNKRLAKARKKLHEYAIKKGYDYLFAVEQDVFPKKNVLKKLLAWDKKVIGAPYIVCSHTNKNRRRIDWILSFSDKLKYLESDDGVKVSHWFLESELKNIKNNPFQVKGCGFGCTLVKVDVLKKIKTRVDKKLNRSDDSYFFEDCIKENIKVFVDISLYGKVEHYRRMGTGFGWNKEKGHNGRVGY